MGSPMAPAAMSPMAYPPPPTFLQPQVQTLDAGTSPMGPPSLMPPFFPVAMPPPGPMSPSAKTEPPTLRASISAPLLRPAAMPMPYPMPLPTVRQAPRASVESLPPPVVTARPPVVTQTGHEPLFRGYSVARHDLEACKSMIRNLNYEMAVLKTGAQDLSLRLASHEAELHMRGVAEKPSTERPATIADTAAFLKTPRAPESHLSELDQALSDFVQANPELGVQIVKRAPGEYEINGQNVQMEKTATKGPCVLIGSVQVPLLEFILTQANAPAAVPKPKAKAKAKSKAKAKAKAKAAPKTASPKAKAKAKTSAVKPKTKAAAKKK